MVGQAFSQNENIDCNNTDAIKQYFMKNGFQSSPATIIKTADKVDADKIMDHAQLVISHKGEKVFPLRLSVISVRKRESELGFLFRVGVNSSFLGKTRFICPIWQFSTIFSGPRAKFPVFFTFNIPVCE